jgi:MYXO-CTERM domain-containing protein
MSMKNFVRSWSVLLAFLCPVLVTGTARATVVWTAGFESNKSGDVCASNMAGAEFTPGAIVVEGTRIDAEVLGEQVYSGKLACKVTVHPDDIFGQYKQDRVDVKHNSTLTGEGKDMYLSGYYYLAADAQTRDEFIMFETTNSLNWFDVWVDAKAGGGTSINVGIESNGANLGSVHVWNGDLAPGTWHQIAIHMLWSQDATKGTLDFWLDGKQVITGYKHKTKPNANDLYLLTGLHRVLMQPSTESIYFDDFIEADTQADIKIGAPGTGSGATDGGAGAGGGSGGVAGGAGSGGTAGAGAAGSSGAAGAGASGAAGSSATGAAGSNATGTAGSNATGAAGSNATGAAGSNTTGAAGSNATGAAGMAATGTAGSHGAKSGGCAVAGDPARRAFALFALALLGGLGARRRRS